MPTIMNTLKEIISFFKVEMLCGCMIFSAQCCAKIVIFKTDVDACKIAFRVLEMKNLKGGIKN